MYTCKSIPTVLPDAVLRCRKLQAEYHTELDQLKKSTLRRLTKLQWEQQSFQKALIERHQKWRTDDRAFCLKLRRELDASLTAASQFQTIEVEENNLDNVNNSLRTSNFHPTKGSQSAVGTRCAQHTKTNHPIVEVKSACKSSRTSRLDIHTQQNGDATQRFNSDFYSVLYRILSKMLDSNDDFIVKKREFEARERRLSCTKDDRYYNLLDQLVPKKLLNENDAKVEDNRNQKKHINT